MSFKDHQFLPTAVPAGTVFQRGFIFTVCDHLNHRGHLGEVSAWSRTGHCGSNGGKEPEETKEGLNQSEQ
jgi:hypothetical protein